jgi:hypothetical protein
MTKRQPLLFTVSVARLSLLFVLLTGVQEQLMYSTNWNPSKSPLFME